MARKSRPDIDDAEYEIGYGRPPREHQFQKGRSGNSKGRLKGALSIKNMILRRLLTRVNVRENGKSSRISTLEALVVKALNDALQGRPKAFVEIFKLFQSAGIFSSEELEKPTCYVTHATVRFVEPEPRYGDPGHQARPPHISSARGTD
jgi:hypothetical protein